MHTKPTILGKRRNFASLLMAIFLAGCTVGPNYQEPEIEMPLDWAGTGLVPTTQPTSTATTRPATVVRWWESFNDPRLASLVTRAAKTNLDLRQAAARIRQARASRAGAAAGQWPTVDASADYRRARSGATGPASGNETDLFRAGFDAAWEIDVFGGIRRQVEAADASLQATIEDRRDLFVTLASEIAINYIDLRGYQQQIAIAQKNLVAQRKSLDISRKRFEQGFVSFLDVANGQAQVATTEAQIPPLESAARQTIYNLSVLLGKPPAALVDELSGQQPIPLVPPEVPIGLPSELLRRRADVRRAEKQVHAATANIGVATSDLFPRFALTGALDFSADKFASMLNWGNRSWSIGPGVSWRLFDGGRINANIEIQNALQEQALIGYEAAVLRALADVEGALVAYAREQEHRLLLTESVRANQKALDLALRLYAGGETDFLNVLNAQRSLFVAEDALVRSTNNVSTNLVSLYKALGGGWEAMEKDSRQ